MAMPPKRRQVLSVIGGSLFVVNLFVLGSVLQSVVGTLTTSSAQFAGGALAVETTRTSGRPLTEECVAGEVHTIKQAQQGTAPDRTAVRCFAKDAQGSITRTASATTNRACQLSKQDRCVIQYCPPQDALRSGKTGTCFVVSCSGGSGTECLKQTLATAQGEGAVGVIRDTLLADPKTAALAPGQGGAINGSEFLTQALNPTVAKQLQESTPQGSAYDKIKDIAGAIENGRAPCTGNNCTPTLQLNKELATEQARLPSERPTIRIPGGPGFPPPPNPSPSRFPNIKKDPSGTDVFAWARYLLGGNKNDQQTQNQPMRARIVSFTAVPMQVTSGSTTNLGWVTEGMRSCIVSSPDLPQFTEDNKNYTNVNGAVRTPPLTATTTFELSCTTLAGVSHPRESLSVSVLP